MIRVGGYRVIIATARSGEIIEITIRRSASYIGNDGNYMGNMASAATIIRIINLSMHDGAMRKATTARRATTRSDPAVTKCTGRSWAGNNIVNFCYAIVSTTVRMYVNEPMMKLVPMR